MCLMFRDGNFKIVDYLNYVGISIACRNKPFKIHGVI